MNSMRVAALCAMLGLAACDPPGAEVDGAVSDAPDATFDAFVEPAELPDVRVAMDRTAPCDPMTSPTGCRPLDAAVSDAPDAARDAPVSELPPEDVPPPSAEERCAPTVVVDANERGVTRGRETFVHLTPEDFSAVTLSPEAPCPSRAETQVVLRYSTSAPASLAVSVWSSEGFPSIEGALWVADRCVAGEPSRARPIECSRLGSFIFEPGYLTTSPLLVAAHTPPSTPLYVVLNGPPRYVVVTLRELYERPLPGAPCVNDGMIDVCPPDTTCGSVPALGRRCLADGTADGARCRRAEPLCDAGLSCTVPQGLHPIGVCHPTVAPGAACDLSAQRDACAAGTCQRTAEGPRCVADGAPLGACRVRSPQCDGALVCAPVWVESGHDDRNEVWRDRGRCVAAALPSGASCDMRAETGGCSAGEVCTPVMGGASAPRCMRVGAAGSRCRAEAPWCDAGLSCVTLERDGERCVATSAHGSVGQPCRPHTPECDAGLVCEGWLNPTCVRPGALGAHCYFTERETCGAGLSCARVVESSTGVCVALGSRGARCRLPPSRCDAGLECGADGRCTPTVAIGATCEGESTPASACQGGALCDSICRADGHEGGRCRRDAVGCDPGLRCGLKGHDVDGSTVTVCWRERALGERCSYFNYDPSGGPTGEPLCARGAECPARGVEQVCSLRGDPGTSCLEEGGVPTCHGGAICREGICTLIAHEGEGCADGFSSRVCDDDTVCDRGTCIASRPGAPGASNGRCRDADPRCDDGLVCDGDETSRSCVGLRRREQLCTTTSASECLAGALGARCSPVALPTGCESSAVCDGGSCVRADTVSSAYVVERREGVPLLDACSAPAGVLPDRFPFVFFGDAYEGVGFDEIAGGVTLALWGGPSAVALSRVAPLSNLEAEFTLTPTRCVRVFGAAPSRRLVFEWRYQPLVWRSNPFNEYAPVIRGAARYEAIFEEDTHAIELRYDLVKTADLPPLDFVVEPRIEGRGRAHLAGTRVRSGTAVRFTPR